MEHNALTKLLESYQRPEWGERWFFGNSFIVRYGGYCCYYEGDYWGYVWREGEEATTKREYSWRSFEDMLNSTIEELGKTWATVLHAADEEELDILM